MISSPNQRLIFLIFLCLFKIYLSCIPTEYFHTDDSLLIKRLHLDPYSFSETHFIRGDILFKANLDESEDHLLFPVLQILDRESMKIEQMIRKPYIYTYFLHMKEKDHKGKGEDDSDDIEYTMYEHSEKVERQNGPPFRFVTGYSVRVIENNTEPLWEGKINEIKEVVKKAYKEEGKTVTKIKIEFKTDFLFNWKIFVVKAEFTRGKPERFSIVDSLYDPEKKHRNLKKFEDEDFSQPKMSISHCLKDTQYELKKKKVYDIEAH
ncbi:MAG: hypothetical protein MJ252_19160 [archaeon]|nr:hypothetical protein [archaeon]